ncbi:T-box-containing protein TBX6L-like isoform X1 [Oryzias latipes]|uniref:T-box-containing protein TBX6L-like isoform X1 n=1 Tax=Oryzias latipes TaxID=8090 RepID=UPI0009DB09D7|nr:T-box-containing protein TBX6L-like isoform X1 [Oryzias latipes]
MLICNHSHKIFFTDFRLNASMPLLSQPAAQAYLQGSVKVTLENADLWKSFHDIGTEMIITKHGRRMFPHCSIALTGLQPLTDYVIMVDMIPVDGFKYKWKKEKWEVAGTAEPQPPWRTYTHPDSPAPGRHWMKHPLSFLKMKLTNNTLDQHGHIILHSMHRYYPRFHVIQTDSSHTVRWGSFQTFSFPETVFTAVTAYQNPKITKLKIDHNPFAKGFREGGTHYHSKRCRSSKRSSQERKDVAGGCPGLERAPSASHSVWTAKRQHPLKGSHCSALEQDSSDQHAEPLELQEYDFSCEEQRVPAYAAYQPNRSADFDGFPLPSGDRDQTQPAYPPPLHPSSSLKQNPNGYQNHSMQDWSQYPLFSYSSW